MANKKETVVRDKDFILPVIKPASMQVQSEGFVFKTYFIRLPEGLIAQDLHDHPDKLWTKVQADQIGKALSQFDRIVAVSFDETWMLEAVVAQAGLTRVVLAGNKITQLPGTQESLFADSTYHVTMAFGFSQYSNGKLMRRG